MLELKSYIGPFVNDLIVLKFHCATLLGLCAQRGKKDFFAFLCISVHFRSIETHFYFSKMFVSAKRKMRMSKASRMRACWYDWLYQRFVKNHFQLWYFFFRNYVCCERQWPLRSALVIHRQVDIITVMMNVVKYITSIFQWQEIFDAN